MQRVIVAGSLVGFALAGVAALAYSSFTPKTAADSPGIVVETVPEQRAPAVASPAPTTSAITPPTLAAPSSPPAAASDSPAPTAAQPAAAVTSAPAAASAPQPANSARPVAKAPARPKNPEVEMMEQNLKLLEEEMQREKAQRAKPRSAGTTGDKQAPF